MDNALKTFGSAGKCQIMLLKTTTKSIQRLTEF